MFLILIAAAIWVAVSVPVALGIGRAMRIADEREQATR